MITYGNDNDKKNELNAGAWIAIILVVAFFGFMFVKTTSFPF
jgi:hypothetical protein